VADEELLGRFVPYLQYDSLESFRSDSAATLPEHFFEDGSKWSYTNVLKRKGTVAYSDEGVQSKLLSSDLPAEG
jgi:hypothetical protein